MKSYLLLLMPVLFAACGTATPAYDIAPTKPEDTIIYTWANDAATFDVTSPGGIGGARFVRTSGDMPTKVFLQLHLQGLESLKFRYDDREVNVSVSSSGAPTVLESARVSGGGEMELAPESEYWIPAELVSVSETIPLADGYIRIELPRAFYSSDAREFSIEWIDFYR